MTSLDYWRSVIDPDADPSHPRQVVELAEKMMRGDNIVMGPPLAFDEARRVALGELRRERDRYREAIEEYILWTPGRRGHAAAHRRLVAALERNEDCDHCWNVFEEGDKPPVLWCIHCGARSDDTSLLVRRDGSEP